MIDMGYAANATEADFRYQYILTRMPSIRSMLRIEEVDDGNYRRFHMISIFPTDCPDGDCWFLLSLKVGNAMY